MKGNELLRNQKLLGNCVVYCQNLLSVYMLDNSISESSSHADELIMKATELLNDWDLGDSTAN